MTNCDVGCVLFIVLVLNKCKPNLREILWQDLAPTPTPLFHWASITATLLHSNITECTAALLIASFYFACVPLPLWASISKYHILCSVELFQTASLVASVRRPEAVWGLCIMQTDCTLSTVYSAVLHIIIYWYHYHCNHYHIIGIPIVLQKEKVAEH